MMYLFITVLCCDDWLVSVCCLEWISDYDCGTRLTGTVRAAAGTVAVSLCVTARAHMLFFVPCGTHNSVGDSRMWKR